MHDSRPFQNKSVALSNKNIILIKTDSATVSSGCCGGRGGGGMRRAFADGIQTQTVRGERGWGMCEWGQLTGLDHGLSLCRGPGGDVGKGPGRLELE